MAEDVFDVVSTGEELDALPDDASASDIWRRLYGHDSASLPANLAYRLRTLEAFAYLRQESAAGTLGGASLAADWTTRVLNSVEFDSGIVESLVGNVFTLGPGTYFLEARAPAFQVFKHKAAITSSGDVALLPGASAFAQNNVSSDAWVRGVLVLEEDTELKLRHWTQTAVADVGLGVDSGNDGASLPEIYSEVLVSRLRT